MPVVSSVVFASINRIRVMNKMLMNVRLRVGCVNLSYMYMHVGDHLTPSKVRGKLFKSSEEENAFRSEKISLGR